MFPMVALVVFWRRHRTAGRFLATVLALLLVALVVLVGFTGASNLSAGDVSATTTGRFDLWTAAVSQFTESPLVGWGAKAYRNISVYMPDYYRYGSEGLEEAAESGGYHQAYLGLLAQRGLLGSIPGLYMVWCLWRVARRRFLAVPRPPKPVRVTGILFVSMVVLRGLAEQAGFFGAADGLIDFMTYAGAAFVICSGRDASLRA